MSSSIIFDYIENIKGISPDKVIHVEDFIETHPQTNEYQTLYSLYSVDFGDKKGVKFVQIASSSANVVIPADQGLLLEIFPDHAEPEQAESSD